MTVAKRTYGTMLLSVVALEVLLPVLILIATTVVRQVQQSRLTDNRSTFEELRISKADEIRSGEEIIYQGVLYDVKEIRKEQNGYLVMALRDNTETDLQQLSAGLAGNNTVSTELKILPFVFLYYEVHTAWQPLQGDGAGKDFNEYYHSPLPLRTMTIISPPPRGANILS